MDVFDEELLNFWRSLNENKVRYILVGGFATNLHGYSRFTSDLDIWIEDSRDNRKRLRKAYAESGNGDLKEIETIEFIAGWTTLYIAGNMELDIMTKLVGFEQTSFKECYEIAPIAEILGVQIKFLHLNHLIMEKLAANRKKDLLDVEELKRLNNIQQ